MGAGFRFGMRATGAMNALSRGKFAIPGMREFAENPLYGNHPTIMRLFARLGEMMGEKGRLLPLRPMASRPRRPR
jgi:hypothetical protein